MKQKTHLITNTSTKSSPPDPPMTQIVPLTDIITENGTYTKTAPTGTAYSPINITVNVPPQTIAFPINQIKIINSRNTPNIQIGDWIEYTDIPNPTTFYIGLGARQNLIAISLINSTITRFQFSSEDTGVPDRFYPFTGLSNITVNRLIFCIFNFYNSTNTETYINPEIQFYSDNEYGFSLDTSPGIVNMSSKIFQFDMSNPPIPTLD